MKNIYQRTTNSLCIFSVGIEETSDIFYQDGISFIPLQGWTHGGKRKQCIRRKQIERQYMYIA